MDQREISCDNLFLSFHHKFFNLTLNLLIINLSISQLQGTLNHVILLITILTNYSLRERERERRKGGWGAGVWLVEEGETWNVDEGYNYVLTINLFTLGDSFQPEMWMISELKTVCFQIKNCLQTYWTTSKVKDFHIWVVIFSFFFISSTWT